ncbi:CpsD/CapB family tyrosine-protein kinase [Falsibacillus albus]|uniref:non-specific protein-tyrosine kinase n=1 Tax=Falsibacillus albus TaxID=2478915 RepID=A0A3L7K120_9BACI|nr:CpsD/CapB family tyrosine-protein kinase [Falsibacillus albus]RLQ96285.1 tyrosine-protein kinase family protein [Falsibacillus albus]
MIRMKRMNFRKNSRRNLIAHTHPDSIISEQYRTILTNIKFSMPEEKSRSIVITSTSLGEGKSTCAANLAVSMAQQKKKVLLIDANLRNPSLHSILKIPNKKGLTDILAGECTFEQARLRTKVGKLDILISGAIPYNPVALLGSQIFQNLLTNALEIYDFVLLDSPSVLEVTDTKLLSNQCDGVVIVVNKGRTKLKKAIEMKKELDLAKARYIGVIINE